MSAMNQTSAATTTATSTVFLAPDPAVAAAIERGHKVVFFDVVLGDNSATGDLGRIKLELFANECPKTCENFRQFCTGEHIRNSKSVGYKDSTFHRAIKDFMIQGGDFINHDGTGKASIYGDSGFPDEDLTSHKHDRPGMLSMANSGPDTNGCQFFITTVPCPWLDGKHVVFGRILDDSSMLTMRKCEAVPVSAGNRPRIPLRIAECGEL
mmetsp:Transcript_1712/g.2630  ORF Transcript_1712/g.2630 Transcript_1712/m.2630 type:complete len:210 (-) Transcript_1712:724-1353(-)